MIAALLLAAGRSSRTAPAHKLLAVNARGESLIARTVDRALASTAGAVYVVLGHEAPAIRRALAGRAVNFIHAPDFERGLSASLGAGLLALPREIDGVMICLGDMPYVTTATLDRMIAAFTPGSIVAPTYQSRRGNPVLWDRGFIAEMTELTGDRGARDLLARHAARVAEIPIDDEGVVRDCDTAEALREWAGEISQG